MKEGGSLAALYRDAGGDGRPQSPLLKRLYEAHFLELCRYIRRKYGAGPPEPEDIVQTAFVKFAGLPDLSEVGDPRAFLFRTAKNIAIDGSRGNKRRERYIGAESQHEVADFRADFNPERVFIGKEEYSLVESVVKSLPARHRRYFLMNRVDGLSFAEIARRENASPSGVRKIVGQALEACHRAVRKAKRERLRGD